MSIATDLARLNQAKTDIAAAIVEKGVEVPSGTKIDGMAPLILEIMGGGSTLTVTAPDGSTITVSNGSESYTKTGGTAVFEGLTTGTWTVTATDGILTETREVEIVIDYTVEISSYARIYGISRDITASSPEWTRTDDAIGFTATASVGTVAGSSSFDNCMPWSGIRRCNLAADGTVNAYMGDTAYAVDGSNGDVMVEIPKFWYRRYREGNIEYIKIADAAVDGFAVHPAFNHAGVEADYVYVGAYKTITGSNQSISGVKDTAVSDSTNTSSTMTLCRTRATGKGTGWALLDISTFSAIQMLFLTEWATNSSQTTIGRGICDATSYTGNTLMHTKTGTCDSVPNLTGRPSGTDGLVDIVWRGIEGIWCNGGEWVDGVNISAGTYSVCNDPSLYVDAPTSGYSTLSYTISTGLSAAYITQMGLDENHPYVMLPSAASGGGASTYFCDTTYTTTSNNTKIRRTNTYVIGSADGLFHFNIAITASGRGCCRLLYIPQ